MATDGDGLGSAQAHCGLSVTLPRFVYTAEERDKYLKPLQERRRAERLDQLQNARATFMETPQDFGRCQTRTMIMPSSRLQARLTVLLFTLQFRSRAGVPYCTDHRP